MTGSDIPDTTGRKNNNKKKSAGNCKVLCVSRKRKKAILKRYAFQANAIISESF